MRPIWIVTMLASLALCVGCQPVQTPEGNAAVPLADTIWLLSDLKGEPMEPELGVTAIFGTDGSLGGSAGCNNYSTSYTVDGNEMAIEPALALTRMICPEPLMAVESAYLDILPSVVLYEIIGEVLILRDADTQVLLTYNAVDQNLAGSSWYALSYNNGKEAAVTVIEDTELTAVFGSDHMISGSAGCNTYSGPFKAPGSEISIGPLGITNKMCEEAVMEQESQFLSALESAATYSIKGSSLQLLDGGQSTAVNFEFAQ